MYELTLYGKDGRSQKAFMLDCLDVAAKWCGCVMGHLERHVRLGEEHIAFYLRTADMPPDTYIGVITYAKDPWFFACGDCGSSCEQGNCRNWKSVSESNPY